MSSVLDIVLYVSLALVVVVMVICVLVYYFATKSKKPPEMIDLSKNAHLDVVDTTTTNKQRYPVIWATNQGLHNDRAERHSDKWEYAYIWVYANIPLNEQDVNVRTLYSCPGNTSLDKLYYMATHKLFREKNWQYVSMKPIHFKGSFEIPNRNFRFYFANPKPTVPYDQDPPTNNRFEGCNI